MIPKIPLEGENLEISRLVCGTNAFCGISHFTTSRDLFLSQFFSDVNKIAEIMSFLAEEFGVNACISSPRDSIAKAIDIVENETGVQYKWICSPSGSRQTAGGIPAELNKQINWCADHNVKVCMPHRSWTDFQIDGSKLEIKDLPEVTAHIRDKGMVPGLSTHYYETILACKKQKYDIKMIVQPVNVEGFQSNIEINTLLNVIRSTDIQIIAIKPMAAGRIVPEVGIDFTLRNIKPNDYIACGFDCLENADFDAQLIERILKK